MCLYFLSFTYPLALAAVVCFKLDFCSLFQPVSDIFIVDGNRNIGSTITSNNSSNNTRSGSQASNNTAIGPIPFDSNIIIIDRSTTGNVVTGDQSIRRASGSGSSINNIESQRPSDRISPTSVSGAITSPIEDTNISNTSTGDGSKSANDAKSTISPRGSIIGTRDTSTTTAATTTKQPGRDVNRYVCAHTQHTPDLLC
jgi:hypothetical protein